VGVRSVIFNHFCQHIPYANLDRKSVENVTFKTLNMAQSGDLTKPLNVEEVKQTMWDCDSFNSMGLRLLILGSLRIFWAS